MSRSKKHGYWFTQPGRKKFARRLAARKIRHSCDVPDGGAFRKFFCSYNICDYKFPIRNVFSGEEWKGRRK